jgi:putative transposase
MPSFDFFLSGQGMGAFFGSGQSRQILPSNHQLLDSTAVDGNANWSVEIMSGGVRFSDEIPASIKSSGDDIEKAICQEQHARRQVGMIFHVLNRGNARDRIFDDDADDAAFEKVLAETQAEVFVRILRYCLMPNHWHLVLWPLKDGDLGRFMQRLTMTHLRRWHLHHHTVGTGHLYQGTYKLLPIQEDDHLYTVLRYVERSAVRPTMVARAEDWTWNSLWRWLHPTEYHEKPILCPWPIPRPIDWVTRVNRALTKKNGTPCKPRSSEADHSARSHGKRQPPNNWDSNPHFAPEAAQIRQSTIANPNFLDLSPFFERSAGGISVPGS